MQAPNARSIAAAVLVRADKEASFVAAALDAELARHPQLDPRDRALATELVYGTLRFRRWLEAQAERHAKRGLSESDAFTRGEISLAAYQLFFLARVPAFAAVNEAVGAVTRVRGPRVASFVNAVLRRLAREAEARRSESGLAERAAWASVPEWLQSALASSIGSEGARAFVSAGIASSPPLGLRVEHEDQRGAWLERLRAAAPAAHFEVGTVSPLAILARGAGDVRKLPGFTEGAWSVQEEGSQLVALSLGARRGEQVLDACAGRGNKSAVLVRAIGPDGALDAADVRPEKLDRLEYELGRLGLAVRRTYAVDWSIGPGECGDYYDRILVDAPCSSTGTIRRRPELLLRREPEDLARLAELQRKILVGAAARARPGGRIVYAVCSVLREEAEEVVERALAEDRSLEPVPFDAVPASSSAPAAELAGPGRASLRLLPHVHGTDGYFLASLHKKE